MSMDCLWTGLLFDRTGYQAGGCTWVRFGSCSHGLVMNWACVETVLGSYGLSMVSDVLAMCWFM
jgi:hypothetical protein